MYPKVDDVGAACSPEGRCEDRLRGWRNSRLRSISGKFTRTGPKDRLTGEFITPPAQFTDFVFDCTDGLSCSRRVHEQFL